MHSENYEQKHQIEMLDFVIGIVGMAVPSKRISIEGAVGLLGRGHGIRFLYSTLRL